MLKTENTSIFENLSKKTFIPPTNEHKIRKKI